MDSLLVKLPVLIELGISPDQYVFLYCEVHKLSEESRPELNYSSDFFESLQKKGFIKMRNAKVELRGPTFKLFPKEKISLDEFIDQYRLIFYETGRPGVMGSKKECIEKMSKFLEDYPQYGYERILRAAADYVESQKANGFQFLQKATYFISKQDKSKTVSSRLLEYLEEQEFTGEKDIFTRSV